MFARDPRYLNALDAVRSELAVPMIARGKLVGVIDVQSTRLDAYGARPRAAPPHREPRRSVHRQRAALPPCRAPEPNTQDPGARLAGIQLDPAMSMSCWQDRQDHARPDCLRRIQRPAGGSRRAADPAHRFSLRYDQRVNVDNIPLGKGITGAAAESREAVRVNDTLADPRYIASHPEIRSEVAVPLIVQDRVVGVMDLESERIGYFTDDHVRMLTPARSADRQLGRERPAVRRAEPARAAHGGRISRPRESCSRC